MRTEIHLEIDSCTADHLDVFWTSRLIDAEDIEQALIGVMLRAAERDDVLPSMHILLEDLSGHVHQWYEDHEITNQYVQPSFTAI